MPTMETFKQCFTRNRDGAGVTWLENGQFHIAKGFMKFEDFKEFIERLQAQIDTKNTLMGFHFRIKTHGALSKENTHPFPLSTKMEDLKKTEFVTDGKVAIHNGIISKFNGTIQNSDTQEFIAEFLTPLNDGCPNWEQNEKLVKLVEKMLGSKMCVFNTDGTYKLLGSGWIEDSGIHYSNSSYKPYTYSTTYNGSRYNSYGYGSDCYGDYDGYDAEDNWYYEYYKNGKTDKKENKVLSTKREVALCYFDQNVISVYTKEDYNNKVNKNILSEKGCTGVLVTMSSIDNVYKYDTTTGYFVKAPDWVICKLNTFEKVKFDKDNSLMEEVVE